MEYWAGMGAYVPRTIFIPRAEMLPASKGGFSAHSSYRITPNDQMSDSKLYGLFWIISGEM